ncbi:MAG: glycine--tRNA ligase [Planctomycetes bacterium]|nr:glycine--tRNA ligase [Planctomycetota bacterium]
MAEIKEEGDLMQKLISLCKRRGFIYQSSEIYGGLKSCYDYGPMGVELKRNIMSEWWRAMVHEREDVVGLDASIIMHPKVWHASGHASGFSDPLVDCYSCKNRFRADKAPTVEPGSEITYKDAKGLMKKGIAAKGYVCPQCGGVELSGERAFNLMFRTTLGSLDPISLLAEKLSGKAHSVQEIRELIKETVEPSQVFLRPETAQAMFVQFANIQQSMSLKVPFGIAQMGKSFRNEITVEHYVFRSCEFEQMEMEYFCKPGTQGACIDYWKEERLKWYRSFANSGEAFRLRKHDKEELAHYADDCYDVEYLYPWGWDELEGVASRTDYDLKKHSEASGQKLTYFDQQEPDPETGKPGYRYTPYVVEPAAGATRAVLVYLLDAYTEEKGVDAKGEEKTRVVLKLHPRLAPIKVAVLPLVRKDGMPEMARDLVARFREKGILASYDENTSIGKRYARHDEVGTPYCLTVDNQSLEDRTLTLRDRDTTAQERIHFDEAVGRIQARLAK